ncbi:MAG: hypothetical protein HYX96_01605 [Chloroflexi bacterium]|nr:hypothetical protein [Chloroflexota bacterium]
MPTCGDCKLLGRTKAGFYVCTARLSQCLGNVTPQTDASRCIKFEKKDTRS